MQAVGAHKDRAVIREVRNMMLFICGSFSLAICSALTGNDASLMNGLNKVWWFLFAAGIIVFLSGFGIKDVGINRNDLMSEQKQKEEKGKERQDSASSDESGDNR